MQRKILIRVMACVFICTFLCTSAVFSKDDEPPKTGALNIATVDNRPLSVDRLVYTALKDIGYNAAHITAASLQAGYQLADNGERDGVISSTPNMEEMYPHLIKAPVILEYTNCNVYTRTGSDLNINEWGDLSGLRVGMLTQRVYIERQTPDDAVKTAKDTTKLVFDGLLQGEYDVVVLSNRSHELVSLPNGVVFKAVVDSLPEYLYMHEKHEELIPAVTKALENVFADGRGDKILNNVPMPEMYPKKTVLHLISSTTELQREDRFSKGLKEAFQDDMSVEWYSIALNSKRFSGDSARLVYFANLLRRDFVSRDISAIIVSGDDALDFLEEYYFLFFRNVPILFYSVGDDYETVLEKYAEHLTGIKETPLAYETAAMGLELFPGTKNLYVINDYTAEGRRYRSAVEKQLEPLSDSINIVYNENISRTLLLEQIESLPEDSLVFVGAYFSDVNGQYFTLNEMERALKLHCYVPVIALYSTDLTYNSIGGKCLDYEKYSTTIAEMLKRILDGEEVKDIPVITDTEGYSRWVFDKNAMDKWGIRESSLPTDTQVINKSLSVWEANPKFAVSMIALLTISLAVIIITQVYRRRDLKMQEELRRAVQLVEEASNAKSAFLANMSHEIRTPMNGIIGFSELALGSGTTPEGKDDYLQKIKVSGEGLLQIINDILDLSKIEAGKTELESIPFDIHEVFKSCQTIITPKALEKGLVLYCYAEPSIGKKLLGDPTRLRQILLNLLSNAVKFTNNGMVKLLSSIEASSEDSVTMRFEVKDSGIGMSQEEVEKIFEPFAQADTSTTRKYGGTGLGLPITKNMVGLMGGELIAESVPGVGSKFRFTLTFKTIDSADEADSGSLIISEPEKPIFKGEILICEDNEINQQVMRDHLLRVGLSSVIAANGKNGVDIVRRRMESSEPPFELIFMDIHMPVMDGIEAAEKLAEMGCGTPIVVVTANVMSNDRESYKAHGIHDYLAKPFTTHELWACLLRYLTPLSTEAVNKDEEDGEDARRRNRLMADFMREHGSAVETIKAAVNAGDIECAHRNAHTLKGLAGLMDMPKLMKAAGDIERALENGRKEFTKEQIDTLDRELKAVLDEFKPLVSEPEAE